MQLFKTFQLNRLWRRERNRVLAELATYSARELMQDLRLTRSEIGDVAAEAADMHVAAYVHDHPDYRPAWAGRGVMPAWA